MHKFLLNFPVHTLTGKPNSMHDVEDGEEDSKLDFVLL